MLADHPTVRRFRESAPLPPPAVLPTAELRRICLEAGADDVGFVAIDRPEVADQRAEIEAVFPPVETLVSLVFRLNREPVRTPARSAGNLEFHAGYETANGTARRIVTALDRLGVRAVNVSAGFPMEMDRFPGKTWVVGHKPIAVAAGLGQMGIHRNVIHPRFGNFIVLDTILVAAAVAEQSRPIDYNPCLECKLCVAACPVGAIAPDGRFDFSACITHNYREFMSGFTDWVEEVAEAKDAAGYRQRVRDSETASLWQSLSFGPNYKAAYCMAVCPAGDEVIGPFLSDKPAFVREVVKPLQDKAEPIYVTAGSDAEAHVAKRFPHKEARRVKNALRPQTIAGFLRGLPLAFQRGAAADLTAIYHFTFTGREPAVATVAIRAGKLAVRPGVHEGRADLAVTADSATWLAFLAGDQGLAGALLSRRLRVRGPARLLAAFGKCFPR